MFFFDAHKPFDAMNSREKVWLQRRVQPEDFGNSPKARILGNNPWDPLHVLG